jgi:hypothetical protein
LPVSCKHNIDPSVVPPIFRSVAREDTLLLRVPDSGSSGSTSLEFGSISRLKEDRGPDFVTLTGISSGASDCLTDSARAIRETSMVDFDLSLEEFQLGSCVMLKGIKSAVRCSLYWRFDLSVRQEHYLCIFTIRAT